MENFSDFLPIQIWHQIILMQGVMHQSKLTRDCHKKYLTPSAFPILGRLKRQAINSALLNRYCLRGGGRPGTDVGIIYSITVSSFNGISAFVGYLMPKPSVYKNSSGTI